MDEIILSYKIEDLLTAEALASHLTQNGLLVRLGTRLPEMNPTEAEVQLNENEVDGATCVVTLWSRGASGSRNVLIEAQRAASQQKLVIADLQGVPLQPTIAGQPQVDLSNWLITRQTAELTHLKSTIELVMNRVREANKALPPDIYLAYARNDGEKAEIIFNTLELSGYDVWWDRKIRPGVNWVREIGAFFAEARIVVLLATKTALTSPYIGVYVERLMEVGRAVLIAELEPIKHDDYPRGLRGVETVKLWPWRISRDKADLPPLLETIRARIGSPEKRKPSREGRPRARISPERRPGHDVFVSYKREERPKIAPYVNRLLGGGLQVWWDVLIEPGSNWGWAVDRALRESRSVAVFWTTLSVGSEEVYTEADHGLRINALFPILLEKCDIPIRMKRIQYVDLTVKTAHRAFDELIFTLKERILTP